MSSGIYMCNLFEESYPERQMGLKHCNTDIWGWAEAQGDLEQSGLEVFPQTIFLGLPIYDTEIILLFV